MSFRGQLGNHPPKIAGSGPRGGNGQRDQRPGVRVCETDAQAHVRFYYPRGWFAREWARWARYWARRAGDTDDGLER